MESLHGNEAYQACDFSKRKLDIPEKSLAPKLQKVVAESYEQNVSFQTCFSTFFNSSDLLFVLN